MTSEKLPSLGPKQVIKALKKAGFYVDRQKGSHLLLKHPDVPKLRVTVAYHVGDLHKDVLFSIIKQAGLSVEEFLKLL